MSHRKLQLCLNCWLIDLFVFHVSFDYNSLIKEKKINSTYRRFMCHRIGQLRLNWVFAHIYSLIKTVWLHKKGKYTRFVMLDWSMPWGRLDVYWSTVKNWGLFCFQRTMWRNVGSKLKKDDLADSTVLNPFTVLMITV